MRISDWSSDVCSSDLLGLVAGHPDAQVLQLELDDQVLALDVADRALLDRHHPARPVLGVDDGVALLEGRFDGGSGRWRPGGLLWRGSGRTCPTPTMEIGRASWRERVCPYV